MSKPTVLVVRVPCPECGMEVQVQWSVTAGDPGVHTFPNGDPGYPPTGPEAEVKSAPSHCESCGEALRGERWDAECELINEETDWDDELRQGDEAIEEEA